jgi:hypothetical protein
VTGDHYLVVVSRPLLQDALYAIAFLVVLCRADGVLDSDYLERAPDVSRKRACEGPKLIVGEISLVAVHYEYSDI